MPSPSEMPGVLYALFPGKGFSRGAFRGLRIAEKPGSSAEIRIPPMAIFRPFRGGRKRDCAGAIFPGHRHYFLPISPDAFFCLRGRSFMAHLFYEQAGITLMRDSDIFGLWLIC